MGKFLLIALSFIKAVLLANFLDWVKRKPDKNSAEPFSFLSCKINTKRHINLATWKRARIYTLLIMPLRHKRLYTHKSFSVANLMERHVGKTHKKSPSNVLCFDVITFASLLFHHRFHSPFCSCYFITSSYMTWKLSTSIFRVCRKAGRGWIGSIELNIQSWNIVKEWTALCVRYVKQSSLRLVYACWSFS